MGRITDWKRKKLQLIQETSQVYTRLQIQALHGNQHKTTAWKKN